MNQEDMDLLIGKHVDAIRTLLRPAEVLALLLIDREGNVWFEAPEANSRLIRRMFEGGVALVREWPTST